MSDQGPPQVPKSPQQAPLASGPAPPGGTVLTAPVTVPLDLVHRVSVNRERLSDWHHKIRSKMFPLVSGMFVRCRVEDAADGRASYKVARVKTLKPDWSVDLDLLTADEVRAGKNHTNYDCISNAKITDAEFATFCQKVTHDNTSNVVEVAHKVEERLRLMDAIILAEPAFHAKKKGEEKKATPASANADDAALAALPEKYHFSENVLLIDEDGSIPMTTTLMELLTNAVGKKDVSEPDTPRAMQDAANNARNKPRAFDDAVASNSAVVSIAEVRNFMRSPPAPLPDPARVINTLRRSACNGNTEFRYDNIPELARATLSVCATAREIVAKEPLFVHLRSPCSVFGDIHGNFADMMFFLDQVVSFQDIMLKFTTTHLLFLGDYVDRGNNSFECIMYLLALKCIAPSKVTLIRGNHESPEVNGDVDVYGYSSFKFQCLERFGREKGMEVWIAINEVFQYLPVVAEIDKKIFCVHGGLPQYQGGEDNRLEILADPSFPRVPVVQCADPTNVAQRMIVNDLLWSDPAGPGAPVDKFGFGPNPRGPDIKTFGARAVDMFCERYGFQYIFRAHQEKADGLRLSDHARVVTIFSTSDYAGHQNGAGCVLVSGGKIRMAIKKPRSQMKEPPVRNQSPGAQGGQQGRGNSPGRR